MTSKPRSTPSLQSLLDTYHYLVRGFRSRSSVPPPGNADLTARNLVVSAALRRDMAGTLRTAPPGVCVAGLSSASVRVNRQLFLLSNRLGPFPHTREEDLVPVPVEGDVPGSGAAYARWHASLYQSTDANAIIIAHPSAAVICAVNGITPNAADFPLAEAEAGPIQRVTSSVEPLEIDLTTGTILLSADGALIVRGSTLAEAIVGADIAARWCEVALGRRGLTP